MRKTKKCLGYGKVEGKCKSITGKNSEYWCDSCDKIRRLTITKQLEDIANSFK